MRWALLAGIAMAAGCGADPATGRLEPGTEAIVYGPEKNGASIRPAKLGDEMPKTEMGFDLPWLDAGTRVMVADDPAGKAADRLVVVGVKEGMIAGQSVRIARKNLRAVPR